MARDDPEQRIRELEQLAQAARPAHPERSSLNRTPGVHRFVGSPPRWGSNWNMKWAQIANYIALAGMFAFVASHFVANGSGAHNRRSAAPLRWWADLYPTLFLVGMVALAGFIIVTVRRSRRKLFVDVTGDGLTCSARPGEVFSLRDAQLGRWGYGKASMGTALHLRSGQNRFVLGGRDHRVTRDKRIQAPQVHKVDAWLWAADFDRLLSMTGACQSGSDEPMQLPQGRDQAAGEATRCLLFPNAEVISLQPMRKVRRVTEAFQSPPEPSLALDISADAISVLEPNTARVTASAQLAQVRATPEMFVLLRPALVKWTRKNASDHVLRSYEYTSPVLVIDVPGLAPLSIGCAEQTGVVLSAVFGGSNRNFVKSRFWWRPQVARRINQPADYTVSAADWLTLVQAFGLTQYLADDSREIPG